jgi:hypothetical protein
VRSGLLRWISRNVAALRIVLVESDQDCAPRGALGLEAGRQENSAEDQCRAQACRSMITAATAPAEADATQIDKDHQYGAKQGSRFGVKYSKEMCAERNIHVLE